MAEGPAVTAAEVVEEQEGLPGVTVDEAVGQEIPAADTLDPPLEDQLAALEAEEAAGKGGESEPREAPAEAAADGAGQDPAAPAEEKAQPEAEPAPAELPAGHWIGVVENVLGRTYDSDEKALNVLKSHLGRANKVDQVEEELSQTRAELERRSGEQNQRGRAEEIASSPPSGATSAGKPSESAGPSVSSGAADVPSLVDSIGPAGFAFHKSLRERDPEHGEEIAAAWMAEKIDGHVRSTLEQYRASVREEILGELRPLLGPMAQDHASREVLDAAYEFFAGFKAEIDENTGEPSFPELATQEAVADIARRWNAMATANPQSAYDRATFEAAVGQHRFHAQRAGGRAPAPAKGGARTAGSRGESSESGADVAEKVAAMDRARLAQQVTGTGVPRGGAKDAQNPILQSLRESDEDAAMRSELGFGR